MRTTIAGRCGWYGPAERAAGVVMHYHGQDGQWHGSSGVAELGTDRPVGSVTKTFTAALVLC
jgi:CubicO group peptidase (beta-lactamase class C family)